ncbi:cupin domain-containing protein [Pontibacter sp. G13]|uniref:cupin domain-containing protein n=1 Tax=Pontibacter sp. G13 TaxID=3074898 RepID=UPI00288B4A5E|nr:cupin domain-containing protein [Pontibacter sp. G13]WNJ20535.1 cupin domain-containing protein [Pontibacter sp. G13]
MDKYCLILLLALASANVMQAQAPEMSTAVDSYQSEELEWGPCPDFMPDGCKIAVLHGDPAKPNVDILFQVPGGANIPDHWHHSAERMILLSGELHVTYEGEQTQIMKEGTYAYGPAKKSHVATCKDGKPCTLFIAFEEPLDAFATERK